VPHTPDLHATDLHATDLHATDLHATDLHATDLHAMTVGSPRWDFERYAPNGGAIENSVIERSLPVNDVIDRFGGPEGRYASPLGTPYASRSLAPDAVGSRYSQYREVFSAE
jgi:hypothetical protein